ncbi:hypothetical protein RSSM_02659 [Rhodopirellula sallentina SM41]|uniref:Uncharacterized protein n=1 Tax=Rhodopirellula sallentina SM41 TaxID=1263870 RepID=M5U353_9BACT|nr:hypothetical protein RSSM_02659 [Rhodopirellula sallentina SM41]
MWNCLNELSDEFVRFALDKRSMCLFAWIFASGLLSAAFET